MPQVVVASAISAGISTVVASSAAIAAAGGAFAFFKAQFIVSFVLGAASQALAKKPSSSLAGQNQGQTVSGRQTIGAHQIVYGRNRIGGNVVYMHTTSGNKYLHMVIAVAGHEIDSFEAVYANEEQVNLDANGFASGGSYSGKIRVKYAHGSHTMQPFTDLQTETAGTSGAWTSNHLLRGSALAYVRLEYDQNKFPNGIPNFSFLIRGKKVYDPRSETTVWSANPALCLSDYLTNTQYGLGCVYANEIDEDALIASANICDEDISLDAGGTENKYEAHGVLSTSYTPEESINKLLSAMAGKAVWSQGKWRILAGAYYTPTLSFDEDDLRSSMRVQTLVSRRENFNTVRGIYLSATDNYVATDFPQIQNSTAVSEDGEAVFKSIELPFTTSSSMAQRLAKIELLKARQQITTTLPLKLSGLKANVGDIINVSNTRLGWANKKFEVVSLNMSLGEALGVDLDLREISTDVFDWSTSEEQAYDPAPNTTLPNAFSVSAPTNLQITASNTVTPDGSTQSALLVTWTPPTNSFVTQYEVQYIRGASDFDWGLITDNATDSLDYGSITNAYDAFSEYGSITDSSASAEIEYNSIFVTTPYYVLPTAVAGAEYAFRVRAINTFGVNSSFVTSNQITYGDSTAPNVPSEIVASGGYKEITLTWINPTVSDFDYVEVYRASTNSTSASTRVGVLRGSKFVDTGLGINVTRYYWLKSVDRTGNKSDFSSPVSATTLFIDSDSFSQEVLNLFSEAGAYGIEPVATLPANGDFDGQIKYDTTGNKLYRWDATATQWTDDIFSITSGSVDEASFAAGVEPIKIVSELPNPTGYTGATIVFLTSDNKLYRYTGTAWTSSIAAGDVTGELSATNFGQSLRPVEVVSVLPSTGNFQGRVVVYTGNSKLYRYTGTTWTVAVETSDLTGTISANQIASNAVTTDKLDANAVTAAKISSGAITTDLLAANSVTTAKLAAAAVAADKIAANAITTDKISANAITGDKIAANTITGGLIAASGIISSAAQIDDAVITGAKIADAAITEAKIADAAITSAKIASLSLVGEANFAVSTAATGARMELTNKYLKVYDANGVLRVHIGDLSA